MADTQAASRGPIEMTSIEIPPRAEYLTFDLGDETYGLELLRAREIIRYDSVTHVPLAPPFIRGVINLRGSVVPIIDLAVIFQVESGPLTRESCIIITEARLDDEEVILGIVADRVDQVLHFTSDEIEPPPSLGTAIEVNYLLGLGKYGSGFVLLLAIDRVLSSSELQIAAAIPEEVEAIELEQADAEAED